MTIQHITLSVPLSLMEKSRQLTNMDDDDAIIESALESYNRRLDLEKRLIALEDQMTASAKQSLSNEEAEDIAWIEAMQADSWDEPPYDSPL